MFSSQETRSAHAISLVTNLHMTGLITGEAGLDIYGPSQVQQITANGRLVGKSMNDRMVDFKFE